MSHKLAKIASHLRTGNPALASTRPIEEPAAATTAGPIEELADFVERGTATFNDGGANFRSFRFNGGRAASTRPAQQVRCKPANQGDGGQTPGI